MPLSTISQLKNDCRRYGLGRKKWWAYQLGVPQLTLSHWFAGRQSPNADHSLKIYNAFLQMEEEEKGEGWKNYLWETYYAGKSPPEEVFPLIILEILSLPGIDSRTLALLSRFTKMLHPEFTMPQSGKLRNRLGWLLTVSNKKARFTPDTSIGEQVILSSSLKSPRLGRHLRRFQTAAGRKWQILDCPLESIKNSLP